MTWLGDWEIPEEAQPKAADYGFDLEAALGAAVSLTTVAPSDAFTADTLGTERAGNGVVIGDGLVLTIGYLIVEAETIWLTLSDGRAVQGHALAYDQPTGFGLVQPLARIDLPGLELGNSGEAKVGEQVIVAGAGGSKRSLAARVVGRQEFAGYWEYVLDEAIFTAPAHPHWGGAALIGPKGDLLGIGSLQLQAAAKDGTTVPLNMVVPINILKPVLEELKRFGRRKAPARPWLGLYATGIEDKVVVVGTARSGPAEDAGVHSGDIVVAVAGEPVHDLAQFYRRVWALGDAGVEVPLAIDRSGRKVDMRITSTERDTLLKRPSVH